MAESSDTTRRVGDIKKLDGTNYQSWKFNAKLMLMERGLWDIVTGAEKAPVATEQDKKEKEIREFYQRSQKAYSLIALSVKEDLQVHIADSCLPNVAWENLQSHFEFVSITQIVRMTRAFYNAKMPEGLDVREHITTMTKLAQQLREMKEDISSKKFAVTILGSLPESYDTFLTSLNARDIETLTWETIKPALIEEYLKRRDRVETQQTEDAFIASSTRSRGGAPGSGRRGNYHPSNTGRRADNRQLNNNNGGSNAYSTFQQNYHHLPQQHVRGGNQNRSVRACWGCGNAGHVLRSCPERNKEEGNIVYEHDRKRMKFEDDDIALVVSSGKAESSSDDWFVDSAASSHMTFNMDLFIEYEPYSEPEMVSLGDNYSIPSVGRGKIRLPFVDENGIQRHLALDRVLYVPDLAKNLLSVRYMTQNKGAIVSFDASKCTVSKGDTSFVIGSCLGGNLYRVNQVKSDETINRNEANMAAHECKNPSVDVWHQRFGHLNHKYIEKLMKNNLVNGMDSCQTHETSNCEACILGKMTRRSFPKKSDSRATRPLEIIHSDVCGPMQVNSIGGSRYILSFIDDYSRYATIYFLKQKSEVLEKFKNYVQMVENSMGERKIENLYIWNNVKAMRSDNGGEYTSAQFSDFCASKGISHQFTNPFSPEQNGVAERFNRTLIESVRSMILHACLPLNLWAEAASTFVYVHNRSPTVALDNQTPYECWFNEKPDVSNLRVFGSVCYYHVPSSQRKKLDPKSKKAIFVGYPADTKGYKVYDLEDKKFKRKEMQNVIFNENEFHNFEDLERAVEKFSNETHFPFPVTDVNVSPISPILSAVRPAPVDENEAGNIPIMENNVRNLEAVGELRGNDGQVGDEEESTDNNDFVESGENNVRETYEETFLQQVAALPTTRVRKPNPRYTEGANVMEELYELDKPLTAEVDEPKSVKEALTCPNAAEWKAAMSREYESLMKNNTWTLVPRPPNTNVVGSRWVFTIKRDAQGDITKFKGRLVAKGFSQTHGVDYDEVFSPVVRFSTLRTLLALANANDWEIHQMDVTTAYLNGKLDCEVYMEQPAGFVDSEHGDYVCKLLKSLYGLKQSARCWNSTLDIFL